MHHIENDISDTVDQIQPDNHQSVESAQEGIAALFARLNPQDVERFYQSYRHWSIQPRMQALQIQIVELQQAIAHNAELMDQYHPSPVAQSILAQFQVHGVNDIDLLDRMLERGDDWLGHTLQLLEQCEQLDIIHNNYTEWCEHALEGAYDWIASMNEDDTSAESAESAIATSEVFDETTEQLLLQKLLSEEGEEKVADTSEIVEQSDNNAVLEENISTTSTEDTNIAEVLPIEAATHEEEEQAAEALSAAIPIEEKPIFLPEEGEPVAEERPALPPEESKPVVEASSANVFTEERPTLLPEAETEQPEVRKVEESATDLVVVPTDDIDEPAREKAHTNELDETSLQAPHVAEITTISTPDTPSDAEIMETTDTTDAPEHITAATEQVVPEASEEQRDENIVAEKLDIATIEEEQQEISLETDIEAEAEFVTISKEEPPTESVADAKDISEVEAQAAVLNLDEEVVPATGLTEAAPNDAEDDVKVEIPAIQVQDETIPTQGSSPAEETTDETITEGETPEHASKLEKKPTKYSRDDPPSEGHGGGWTSLVVPKQSKDNMESDEDTIAIPAIHRTSFLTTRATPLPSPAISRAETQPNIPAIAPDETPALTGDDTAITEANTISDLPAVMPQASQPEIPLTKQVQATPVLTHPAETYGDTNKQPAIQHTPRLIWQEPDGYSGQAFPQISPPLLPETRPGFFRRLWLRFLAWLKG